MYASPCRQLEPLQRRDGSLHQALSIASSTPLRQLNLTTSPIEPAAQHGKSERIGLAAFGNRRIVLRDSSGSIVFLPRGQLVQSRNVLSSDRSRETTRHRSEFEFFSPSGRSSDDSEKADGHGGHGKRKRRGFSRDNIKATGFATRWMHCSAAASRDAGDPIRHCDLMCAVQQRFSPPFSLSGWMCQTRGATSASRESPPKRTAILEKSIPDLVPSTRQATRQIVYFRASVVRSLNLTR